MLEKIAQVVCMQPIDAVLSSRNTWAFGLEVTHLEGHKALISLFIFF